jgi:hypothetical protein
VGLKQVFEATVEGVGEGEGGGDGGEQASRLDGADLGAGNARPGGEFLLRPLPGGAVQPHLVLDLPGA